MSPSIAIVVFARFNSSRLPGKALLDFGGIPLMAWVMRRAMTLPWPVMLSTSTEPADDALAACANALGCEVYRGDLDDVLGRAAATARQGRLDIVARLCGDRPYFDVEELARAIRLAAAEPEWDLVSNWLPQRTARGLTTEVISRKGLEDADASAHEPHFREHMTSWFYQPAAARRVLQIESAAHHVPGHWAVDTPDDLRDLYPRPGWSPQTELARIVRDRFPAHRQASYG